MASAKKPIGCAPDNDGVSRGSASGGVDDLDHDPVESGIADDDGLNKQIYVHDWNGGDNRRQIV